MLLFPKGTTDFHLYSGTFNFGALHSSNSRLSPMPTEYIRNEKYSHPIANHDDVIMKSKSIVIWNLVIYIVFYRFVLWNRIQSFNTEKIFCIMRKGTLGTLYNYRVSFPLQFSNQFCINGATNSISVISNYLASLQVNNRRQCNIWWLWLLCAFGFSE